MFQVEFQMKQLLKEMQKYHLLKVEIPNKQQQQQQPKNSMSEFILKIFISVLNNSNEVFISFLVLRLIKVL